MWWKKPNELQKRASELVKTMGHADAVKFCITNELDCRHEAEKISKRYRQEYLDNRKSQTEWRQLADLINKMK
jgi:hypothetical protein